MGRPDGEKVQAATLSEFVIAGLDPAIDAVDKSAWTTGSSPVVTSNNNAA
jgi:hypothetical protein